MSKMQSGDFFYGRVNFLESCSNAENERKDVVAWMKFQKQMFELLNKEIWRPKK